MNAIWISDYEKKNTAKKFRKTEFFECLQNVLLAATKCTISDVCNTHTQSIFECTQRQLSTTLYFPIVIISSSVQMSAIFMQKYLCRDRESEAHDDAVYSTIQNSNIKLPIGRFFSPLSLSSERLFLLFVFERVRCIWWWWWCMQKYIKNQIQTEQKTIK